MNLAFLETPRIHPALPWLFPLLHWKRSASKKSLYLTFDDGPTPGITNRILNLLDQHNAKATFFCVGAAAERSIDLMNRLHSEGHSIGNHTYSHLSGWRCSTRRYLDDIQRCEKVLPNLSTASRHLFRPPYGQLGLLQGMRLIIDRSIVMWDVNSMDYLENETSETIGQRVVDNMRQGSIVLMHDSEMAGEKTLHALPMIIGAAKKRDWKLCAIK